MNTFKGRNLCDFPGLFTKIHVLYVLPHLQKVMLAKHFKTIHWKKFRPFQALSTWKIFTPHSNEDADHQLHELGISGQVLEIFCPWGIHIEKTFLLNIHSSCWWSISQLIALTFIGSFACTAWLACSRINLTHTVNRVKIVEQQLSIISESIHSRM